MSPAGAMPQRSLSASAAPEHMVLDSSAVVVILMREPGFETLVDKLCETSSVGIGAPALVEAGIVLSARTGRDARGILERFATEASIEVVPFSDAHWAVAVHAWMHFGKGRHPASLNFGDCLAYAVATVAAAPLLCVGDDFAQTDLAIA